MVLNITQPKNVKAERTAISQQSMISNLLAEKQNLNSNVQPVQQPIPVKEWSNNGVK